MKRGFKTQCEELALKTRASLQLGPIDKLCPFVYAKLLGVTVVFPNDLDLADGHKQQLTRTDPDSWSGLTLRKGSSEIIVLNPTHSQRRQVSTLMHELSHRLLTHLPAQVNVSEKGMLLLGEYDDQQEEEADWLAATLLLPRDALLTARRAGKSPNEIATFYGVSVELCVWRLRMTGVDAQLRASKRT